MIYVFLGEDVSAKKKQLDIFLKKNSEKNIIFFDDLDFKEEDFLNILFNQDFFEKEKVVVLNQVFISHKKTFLENIEQISKSKHDFIFLEKSLDKKTEELIEPFCQTFKKFEIKETKEKFSVFSLTDAFGEKNKKKLWILFQKAIRASVSAEEILNILIWQIKNIILVKNTNDLKKTGLSPFVFQKAKKFSENFNQDELKKISRDLVIIFHEGHLGKDVEISLELFILQKVR